MIGTSLVVASGCEFNNCIDRDIDLKMERTKNRVLVQGLISLKLALAFATVLGVAGVALLYKVANPLAALFAVIGFVIYVGFYSLYLKRKSVHGTLFSWSVRRHAAGDWLRCCDQQLRHGRTDVAGDVQPVADAAFLRHRDFPLQRLSGCIDSGAAR